MSNTDSVDSVRTVDNFHSDVCLGETWIASPVVAGGLRHGSAEEVRWILQASS